ncbi:MAG TPA: response regulator [Terracidiphilus sp.]|jgi:CheY-like chemotaxis protein|nr:response regulator [Terracidiphilus sp.]
MKTILVAEDNVINRELITEMLELLGWRVIQARDGLEALDLLIEKRPDAVLMDLQMPCMDGREAIRRIRDNPAWQGLHVIACTAFAMQGDREEILGLGFDGYISKPVSLAELDAALQIQ